VWRRRLHLGVRAKLIGAFILTIGTVVIGMILFLQWSFGRGFLDYLHQTEARHLEAIEGMLAQQYTACGDWQFLRNNARRWFRLLATLYGQSALDPTRPPQDHPWPPCDAMPEDGPEPLSHRPSRDALFDGEPGPVQRRPRSFPADILLLGPRLSVLDAEHQLVVGGGRHASAAHATLRPIRQGDRIVGWLRLTPLRAVTDRLDRRFLRRQSEAFSLIAVVAMALAVGVSACLARHFLAPVTELAHGTRALIAGQFGTRLRVASRDELGQLARDFNTLAHTLAHNEQTRRHMTADIAHELRTPLAILQGEIEALADGVRPCDAAALQSLHTEVLTLHTLVEDLYHLSLSDLGALTYRKAPVDLTVILANALHAFADRWAEKHLTLQRPFQAEAPVQVCADAERLSQLFTNLFENTLRYTDPGGQIRVWYTTQSDAVTIHVQDSAPGVPEDALPKLFDRWYRVETSRNRASGGTGLGLAICKNIVDAHEGKIWAQPSPLGGLWIQILLPLDA
jgi:two-component system sensor histidine kinase BaeS